MLKFPSESGQDPVFTAELEGFIHYDWQCMSFLLRWLVQTSLSFTDIILQDILAYNPKFAKNIKMCIANHPSMWLYW